MTSPWLTPDQAVEYLGLPSRKALYQRVRRGQIPVCRFGRNLRFNRAELDKALHGSSPIAAAVQSALQRPSAS